MLETARGQVRVFKRLDAAMGVMFEIGFGEITIPVNDPSATFATALIDRLAPSKGCHS